MNLLVKRRYKVTSLGVFDSFRSFLRLFLLNFRINEHFIVSSNLKANLISLLLFRGKLVLIINGLGRYRGNYKFRASFRHLLDVRHNSMEAIFQNYADYRFYRRFCLKASVHWIPGSGGVARDKGTENESYVVVQRDSKIDLVADSLNEFRTLVGNKKSSFIVVGCSRENNILNTKLSSFRNVGRYPQGAIFKDGASFVQPEGYGEGVPHSLVDAICSGMQVFIRKHCFLKYGLHKLDCNLECIDKSWGRLCVTDLSRHHLSLDAVNMSYAEVIEKMQKGKK